MTTGLHIERRGAGPRIVLLHGWGLNLRVWDGLVASLSGDFELVLVDLPGHGASAWTGERTLEAQAELVRRSLLALGDATVPREASPRARNDPSDRSRRTTARCARPTLLGWSLGGQIALHLAQTSPDELDALVLIATTPRFTAAADWAAGLSSAVLRSFAERLRADYRRTVTDFLELQVRGSPDALSVLRALERAVVEHGQARPAALEAGLDILATADLRAGLPHLTLPALVVSGQYDRVTPPAAGRALAAALPEGRYLEIRRGAHAPFLSHPAEIARAVREFVAGPGTPRAAVRTRGAHLR